MLSNQSTNLHQATTPAVMPTIAQRRRQHKRQNSTPTGFETVKNMKNPPPTASNMPTGRPAGAGHRRGMSLDTRRQHVRQRSTASAITTPMTAPVAFAGRDFGTVSMDTNTGLADSSQQHDMLREAQQQRVRARPGTTQEFTFPLTGQQNAPRHSNNNSNSNNISSHSHSNSSSRNEMIHENYLVSPHENPNAQRFDQCFDPNAIPFDQYLVMQKSRANFANAMASANEIYGATSSMSTPTYMEFPEGPGPSQGWTSEGETTTTRRTSRRISNGIMDRVSKFEDLGEVVPQRPGTPPNQNANDCLSARQMEAPPSGLKEEDEQRPCRFSEGYDESMEETIKPNRRARPSVQTAFDDMRRQAEQAPQHQRHHQPIAPAPAPAPVAVPQRSNTMPSFDAMPIQPGSSFMDMNQFSSEFMRLRDDYEDVNDALNPHTSPFDNLPDLRPHDSISQPPSPQRSSGHHRRTDSLASIASAASISSIIIEETRTETGITIDDIANYIRGPDPSDNKWLCLFDGCGKRFGRKENIKSHVQTHLNDRQYQCPSCHKCFVRQHDLKRHAKIHTGVKPYPCECGNSFARHDALTRHRQRGMCVGAFDGIVRKVVKRGRPRKHRPDMEDRVDKASRARKKNLSISSVTSSMSGYSDLSSDDPASPRNDEFDMMGSSGFDLMHVSIDGATINGVAPVMGQMGGGVVGGSENINLAQYANSPESAHSYISPGAIMDPSTAALPPQPPSPAKSTMSHFAEPPELSQSSSPPPCRLFDMEPNNTSSSDAASLSFTMPQQQQQNIPTSLMMGGEQDEEMLLKAFTHDERLLHLERDPSMYGVSKFDEEFAVSMMNAENDMFFGPN